MQNITLRTVVVIGVWSLFVQALCGQTDQIGRQEIKQFPDRTDRTPAVVSPPPELVRAQDEIEGIGATSVSPQQGVEWVFIDPESESVGREFVQTYIPRNMRVAVRDNSVRLDWYLQATDSNVGYVIYRHRIPIDSHTVHNAIPIATLSAQSGENRFYDVIFEIGYWYYAVTPFINEREVVNYFLRRHNATEQAVEITAQVLERSRESLVQEIAVGASGSAVGLTFVSDNPFRDLYVIRSTQPIVNQDTARRAERIARLPGESSKYVDRPPSGVNLYYAVVDAHTLELTNTGAEIRVGENATRFPIQTEARDTRTEPTPFDGPPPRSTDRVALPLINTEFLDGEFFESIEILNPKKRVEAPRSPIEVLYPDTLETTSAHERELRAVLGGSLKDAVWEDSLLDLQNLLRKNPNSNVRARIKYYRGQVFFYRREYQRALFEFTQSQAYYPQESARWIDRVLNSLSN